jgi:predicted outer membrane repeat protein
MRFRLPRLAALPLTVLFGALPALLLLWALAPATAAQAGGKVVTDCSSDEQFTTLLAGGGSITFDCATTPVTLSILGPKVITQPTTIDGGGLMTLNGDGARQLFQVLTGTRLSLVNISLANGRVNNDNGGAIFNQGYLSLLNTTIQNSQATADDPSSYFGTGGAVYNDYAATLVITHSRFISNSVNGYGGGGAIYSVGALTITDGTFINNLAASPAAGGALQAGGGTALIMASAFLSNTAGYGGAIGDDAGCLLTLLTSRLAGNVSLWDGGAIDIDSGKLQTEISNTFTNNLAVLGDGGAIFSASFLTVRDSLFTGNAAGTLTSTDRYGGAIYNYVGGLDLLNSTVYSNVAYSGGGLYSRASLRITNTTLANNTALITDTGGNLDLYAGLATLKNTLLTGGQQSNCHLAGGGLLSLGNNLDSGNSCGLTASGDLTNTNPRLGPLSDNGGPTLTLPLLPGSPAINHGGSLGCPAADQRGQARPAGACDIGAYEAVLQLYLPLVRR